MKYDLPVIILNELVLIPENEIRLDFNSDNKTVLDVSEMFHDNKILMVPNINNTLSNIGVLSIITNKIELPNNITRVTIKGINRVKVLEYMNLNDENNIEAIVQDIIDVKVLEEEINIKKLQKETELFIHSVPFISNSILNSVKESKSLSKLTDIISPFINDDFNRLIEYLNNNNPLDRTNMILEDIYKARQNIELEKQIDFKIKKELDKNQKEYILKEKMKYIKKELGYDSANDLDNLYKKLEENNYPENIKKRVTEELKKLDNIPSTSPELAVTRNYIDWLLKLPTTETIDNKNLKEVKKILDSTHYNLCDIKQRIIEYLAVKQNTNNSKTPIICLVGPPGVGKTTLAYSIASSLNRKFYKINVAGINDEAEIIGHRKTYLGSSPGRIITSIIKTNSKNPIILIDEIDKMTKDIKGDPASCLLNVLDYSQNKQFSDNYIEEYYDLSNIMFILTANYIDNIPEPLKDRLEIIEINGYTELEKLSIAKNYLLKNILKNNGLDKLNISDRLILKIINEYTKETGVRELNRLLDKIARKIVYEKIVNNNDIKVKDLNTFLGNPIYKENKLLMNNAGIINGLAYTPYGGSTIKIETTYYKGTGKLILTGQIGEVMQESCSLALSYIKSNHELFNIDENIFNNIDIHIHFPLGSIKKEGPSAGIAITSSIISSLTNKKISNQIAMTGEIGLYGEVLKIGGLKEKALGALRDNIKEVLLPFDNLDDYELLDEEIKNNINFIAVKNYKEVYKIITK